MPPHTGESGIGCRLRDKLARHARVLSGELVGQIRLIYHALRNPATPLAAKMTIAAALAYFVLPTDALPDFLPGLGFTDDAAVIGLAIHAVRDVLRVQRAAGTGSTPMGEAGRSHRLAIGSGAGGEGDNPPRA